MKIGAYWIVQMIKAQSKPVISDTCKLETEDHKLLQLLGVPKLQM